MVMIWIIGYFTHLFPPGPEWWKGPLALTMCIAMFVEFGFEWAEVVNFATRRIAVSAGKCEPKP